MNTTPTLERPWMVRMLHQCGRDLGYLLLLLPIATIAFSAIITMLLTSVSLIIVWVGVPLLVLTLWAARGFAEVERKRLGALGYGPVRGVYGRPSVDASPMRRFFHPLHEGRMWLDAVHAVVVFPLAMVTWSIAVAWTATALVGSTALIWERADSTETASNSPVLAWLDSPTGETVVGVIALISLPWVLRGLAHLHLVVGRALLATSEERRLREEVARLQDARGAAAAAETSALRRIERDIHDGPQQRLIRMQMDADRAARLLEDDPAAAHASIQDIRAQATETLAELRAMTRGFAPPLLTERGLVAAVESLAERSTIAVALTTDLPSRLSESVEATVYFVVSEALANAAKHSQASAVSVSLESRDGDIVIQVCDNGLGGAHIAKGHGLAGLSDRVAGAGGTLTVADAPAGGTEVTARVPVG